MSVLRFAARTLFAIALIVFAVQHFLYARFISTLIPAWFPGRLFLAYFVGAAFLGAALAIASGVFARLAGALLGLMFLIFVVTTHIPRIVGHGSDGNEWTSGFVALAMGGGSWVFSAVFGGSSVGNPAGVPISPSGPMRMVGSVGRILFAVALVGFAAQHLIGFDKTTRIGPPFFPGTPAMAYLMAAAFFATAVVLLFLPRYISGAAGPLGALLLAIFLLQHVPRILPNLHDPRPWTSAFEILALGSASLALASPAFGSGRAGEL
jgi:uncharacterized membrane protein YphA (DoxX/SURF4 family)